MTVLLIFAFACRRDTQLADFDGDGAFVNYDCNDRDPRISPFLEEVPGDGFDNDCDPETPDRVEEPRDTSSPVDLDADADGVPDLLDCDPVDPLVGAERLWYPDCDGDGFAAEGATEVSACEPPGEVGGCVWVRLAPGDPPHDPANESTDCDDGAAEVFPGQDLFFGEPIPDAAVAWAWDYDCDGSATLEYGAGGITCEADLTAPDQCVIVSPVFLEPTSCGTVGSLVDDCVPGPAGCVATGSGFVQQRCR